MITYHVRNVVDNFTVRHREEVARARQITFGEDVREQFMHFGHFNYLDSGGQFKKGFSVNKFQSSPVVGVVFFEIHKSSLKNSSNFVKIL